MIFPKAFLQERIIYEYMMYRFSQRNLRIKLVVKSGKRVSKPEYKYVKHLDTITDTFFPDINNIHIETSFKGPAEVKFLTSEFKLNDYDQVKLVDFGDNNGCIIVLRHDFLPKTALSKFPEIYVYELNQDDFKLFVLENFNRLLHRQLLSRESSHLKIWLFSQSPNFYKNNKNSSIEPASASGIWCPTDNLDNYDLSLKDKVIFIKFGGEFQINQKVMSSWKRKEIYPNWIIQGLYIGEVTFPIMSRREYCDISKVPYEQPLWHNELKGKRWDRIFGFKKLFEITCNVQLKKMHAETEGIELVHPILHDVSTQQVSRELSESQYTNFLEYILNNETVRLNNAIVIKSEESNAIIRSFTNEFRDNILPQISYPPELLDTLTRLENVSLH